MNKSLLSVLAIILTVGTLSFLPKKLMAEEKNFNHVIPFSTTSGRIGFFDQSNGKIYIYDENMANCVFNGQLNQLGSAIQGTVVQTNRELRTIPVGGSTY
jgi:hypothetical protein